MNPKRLALFYRDVLGVKILTNRPEEYEYDGVELGFDMEEPHIWVWNELKWGKSNNDTVTMVFYTNGIEKTYDELLEKGGNPVFKIADWGGKEISLKDPDGNTVLVLEG